MSLLTTFISAAATSAESIIGQEEVVIGGTTYQAVLSETTEAREYDVPGFKPSADLRAVFRLTAAPTGNLLGKLATTRGTEYRIGTVTRGAAFVMIDLHEKSRS